ncbi:MAG: hypothetical protein HQL82_04655 [Magnetococcales bacterium]|nr:hypothetical protein [Magnetococcales bacterium]
MPRPVQFQLEEIDFLEMRGKIQFLIDTYRINAEKWVLDLFQQIPQEPGPDAVRRLEKWLNTYLPEPQRSQLLDSGTGPAADAGDCITVTRETLEQLRGFQRFFGLESDDVTIRELLAAYRDKKSMGS